MDSDTADSSIVFKTIFFTHEKSHCESHIDN
jgi:hypothetical protein